MNCTSRSGCSNMPRVSVGIPVFNGEWFLPATLDAILAQDFADFEVIISDNASIDGTAEICHLYSVRDQRVRYYRSDLNRGAAHNYNRVAELARGEYFKWASYDDIIAPGYLGACVRALDARPDAVLAYPKTEIIDEHGQFVRHHRDDLQLTEATPWGRLRRFTWRWNLCNPVFGLIRTDVLRRTRLIEPYVSSDVTLLADLSIRGQFLEVPAPMFFRRVHATSSRQGNLSRREISAWFDPALRPGLLADRTVVFLRIIDVILQSQLSPSARARTLGTFVFAWSLRRGRVRGGQLKSKFSGLLRRDSIAYPDGKMRSLASSAYAGDEDVARSRPMDRFDTLSKGGRTRRNHARSEE